MGRNRRKSFGWTNFTRAGAGREAEVFVAKFVADD